MWRRETHVPRSTEKNTMCGADRVWTCGYQGWIMLLNAHQTVSSADETAAATRTAADSNKC